MKRVSIGPLAPTWLSFTYTAVISQRAFSPKQQPAGLKFTSSLPLCRDWQSRRLLTRPICWRIGIIALVRYDDFVCILPPFKIKFQLQIGIDARQDTMTLESICFWEPGSILFTFYIKIAHILKKPFSYFFCSLICISL